jgi:hypothetical protein
MKWTMQNGLMAGATCALAVALAGCSSSDAASSAAGGAAGSGPGGGAASAPNTVTYEGADGVARTFGGQALAQVQSNGAMVIVRIASEGSGACEPQSTHFGKEWLELGVIRNGAGAQPPIAAGSYPFKLTYDGSSNVHTEGYVNRLETDCHGLRTLVGNPGALPGTFTITSMTDSEIDGTFDFDGEAQTPSGPPATGHASGSFKAKLCPTKADVSTKCAE